MAQDRFGRRLIHRGGSPPSSFASEDMMMRAVRLPQRNCFTDTQMNRQRPLRTKTTPSMHNTVAGGPRLPRNRIGSLFNTTAGDVPRAPVRTQSATTLYVKPVSPPLEHRVPPVATISRVSNHAYGHQQEQQFDSGLGLEKPKPARKPSIPGYRARCIDDAESDDEIQTDYVHESIKPLNPETSSLVTPQQLPSLKPQPRNLSFKLTPSMLQKQDSGVEEQQMDTLQSPTSSNDGANESSFDPQTYQRHLEDIQRSAMEWSRLQEGLAMLLPNVDGDTGFHHAVIHTRLNILSRLLELVEKYPQLRSCVNDQNSLYQTSLHLAVHLQQVDMMKLLINAGASLHLQDHKGNTPLHIACQQKNTLCLDQLLSSVHHTALTELAEIRNYEGNSCVHSAAYAGNTDAMLKLKGAGIDIDMKTYGAGKTALHIAIEKDSFQLAQVLIQSCGSDINRSTYSGCTPLHIAAGWGNSEIVAYLISLGADPYAVTDEGDLAIHLVSDEGVRQFLMAVTGI